VGRGPCLARARCTSVGGCWPWQGEAGAPIPQGRAREAASLRLSRRSFAGCAAAQQVVHRGSRSCMGLLGGRVQALPGLPCAMHAEARVAGAGVAEGGSGVPQHNEVGRVHPVVAGAAQEGLVCCAVEEGAAAAELAQCGEVDAGGCISGTALWWRDIMATGRLLLLAPA